MSSTITTYGTAVPKGYSNPRTAVGVAAGIEARCQRCRQTGHWTYECTSTKQQQQQSTKSSTKRERDEDAVGPPADTRNPLARGQSRWTDEELAQVKEVLRMEVREAIRAEYPETPSESSSSSSSDDDSDSD